jgi:hypothetical protein
MRGNDGRHPAVLRRDEHIDRAGHVRLVRGEGVLHRPGHGRDGRLVKDPVRAREGFHQEIEVGDAPLDERHPGVVQEVLDVHPPSGGEVVDDDDVVVLCQIRRFVRNRARAPPRMTFQRNGVGAPEMRGAVVPTRFEPIEPARGESREGGFPDPSDLRSFRTDSVSDLPKNAFNAGFGWNPELSRVLWIRSLMVVRDCTNILRFSREIPELAITS